MYRGNDEKWFYKESVREGEGTGRDGECQQESENNEITFDKEYYDNEFLPYYLVILEPYGFNAREIGKMTFSELKPYNIAYKKKNEIRAKEREYNAWLIGAYTRIAVSSSNVGNSSLFTKKVNEYPKHPYSDNESKKSNITVEQSESIAIFEMNKFIRDMEYIGLPQAPD